MQTITELSRDILLNFAKPRKIYLEGNILKVITPHELDREFREYIKDCRDRDVSMRRKRLEVTKQVQRQVRELKSAISENERLVAELNAALEESTVLKETAEREKHTAVQDLELLQKRKRFELINTIVKIALYIVVGVGITTSGIFVIALLTGVDSPVIENTWSNLLGILLTNAFSIIGTLMGVKYANTEEDMGE